jgi:hypothetical protein
MFTQGFDSYVVAGDRIVCEADGYHCVATLHPDTDTRPEETISGYDAWYKDEWHYFAVAVTVWRNGVKLTHDFDHALWGIDGNYPGGDNSHFRDVANDLLPEAMADAKVVLAKLVQGVA